MTDVNPHTHVMMSDTPRDREADDYRRAPFETPIGFKICKTDNIPNNSPSVVPNVGLALTIAKVST